MLRHQRDVLVRSDGRVAVKDRRPSGDFGTLYEAQIDDMGAEQRMIDASRREWTRKRQDFEQRLEAGELKPQEYRREILRLRSRVRFHEDREKDHLGVIIDQRAARTEHIKALRAAAYEATLSGQHELSDTLRRFASDYEPKALNEEE